MRNQNKKAEIQFNCHVEQTQNGTQSKVTNITPHKPEAKAISKQQNSLAINFFFCIGSKKLRRPAKNLILHDK
jgi:hypothetical protein